VPNADKFVSISCLGINLMLHYSNALFVEWKSLSRIILFVKCCNFKVDFKIIWVELQNSFEQSHSVSMAITASSRFNLT